MVNTRKIRKRKQYFERIGLANNQRVWVTPHACTRLKERVINPYGLGSLYYLKKRGRLLNFIKKLAMRAIEEGDYDERKKTFSVPWPEKEEVPDIALALKDDHGVVIVKTCWPKDDLEEEYWEEE